MMNRQVKQHNPLYRNQSGGTFLGLILGLIVGLGIAVVVALVITKSPIPFVNKVTKQERTALSPGQAADPNRPLYGMRDTMKEAGRDASRPVSGDEASPPDSAALSPQANDAVKEKPAAVPHDQGAADDKWRYYLQTGAFRGQAEAESARAKLALLGFESKISERSSESGTLYRVRIGPFSQVETMNRMRGKLSDNGVDAAIVRIPK